MEIYVVQFVDQSFLQSMNVILITFSLIQKEENLQRIIAKYYVLVVI